MEMMNWGSKDLCGLFRIKQQGIFHLQLCLSFRTFYFLLSICPFFFASCPDNFSSYFPYVDATIFFRISLLHAYFQISIVHSH